MAIYHPRLVKNVKEKIDPLPKNVELYTNTYFVCIRLLLTNQNARRVRDVYSHRRQIARARGETGRTNIQAFKLKSLETVLHETRSREMGYHREY